MSEEPIILIPDYNLAEDELACIKAIREDFSTIRASFLIQNIDLDPKEALREVLGREQHRLPTPMSLWGPHPWRDGRVGKPIPGNWEIAFMAITPCNLREDTQMVSNETRAAYRCAVGTEARLSA